MRRLVLLLPLLAGVAASPAYAASVSGRAELKVGYDEPRGTIQVFNGETGDFGKGGVGYGAEIGGDVTVGSGFLFGVYGGVDLSQADGCHQQLILNTDEACIKSKNNLYAGLRAGLTIGTNGLVYVKGGYSRAKFRASYDGTFPPNIHETFDGSGSASGFHVGGGFEYNVTRHVYIKGEYVYTNYRDALKDAVTSMSRCDVGPGVCRFNPTRQQLMFGVGLRFGGEAAPPPPPPPPPPVPATQTCPDGSVIDASAVCPPPPPPPPPPPAPTERGERG